MKWLSLLLTPVIHASGCTMIEPVDDDSAETLTGELAQAVTCDPVVQIYPVRGPHNHGWDSAAGYSSLWTCNAGRSNSDWIPTSSSDFHVGNDIWAARGTPVVSVSNGVVTTSGLAQEPGPGWRVVVRDDCGWFHFYYHLN